VIAAVCASSDASGLDARGAADASCISAALAERN
jgi:hypothetical protein